MGIQACRKDCWSNSTSLAANAGLLLANHLKVTGDDNVSKKELFRNAIVALQKAKPVYAEAFSRWLDLTSTARFESQDMAVSGRMVVGLGAATVLESAIALHHTYGTPIIPGSALKGLTAHFCDMVLGAVAMTEENEYKLSGIYPLNDGKTETRPGHYYKMLFGANDSAGIVTFHDAWILPESIDKGSGLVLDVMTPHHQKYNSGTDGAAPNDSEDPIPIPFLSCVGKFRLVLEVEDGGADALAWRSFTMKLLTQALASWGVGGKTSSGYGRLEVVAPRS